MQEEQKAVDAPVAGQKRGRGRPKGSKTKPKPQDDLPPPATAAEGVGRMLESRKLSNKINYDNIKALFSNDGPNPPTRSAALCVTMPILTSRCVSFVMQKLLYCAQYGLSSGLSSVSK